MKKRLQLDYIEERTRAYLADLHMFYPHQDIAEFRRLVQALRDFLTYGLWSRNIEGEDDNEPSQ